MTYQIDFGTNKQGISKKRILSSLRTIITLFFDTPKSFRQLFVNELYRIYKLKQSSYSPEIRLLYIHLRYGTKSKAISKILISCDNIRKFENILKNKAPVSIYI